LERHNPFRRAQTMLKSRKRLWLGALVLTLCGVSGASGADTLPVKVGFLLSYTGITPLQAKGVNDGATLAFEEAQNKAGGRSVQILKEDTEFNPTVALTKVRKLVEEQKVSFIVGPVGSAEAMAIRDYVAKQKVVMIIPCAFTRDITSPAKASLNIFRTVETTDQANYPMGKWLYDQGKRNVVLVAQDYKAGHDCVDAFRAAFEKAGGKIAKEVYPPVGTMDFASFLAAIDVKGADAVYSFFGGTDAVRFVQQYQEYGLKNRIPLYGYTGIADDPYLESMGDAVLGVYSSTSYTASVNTPANKAFVAAYQKRFKESPSHYSEYGYVAGKMIVAALNATKGNVDDVEKLSKAMAAASSKLQAPSGPLSFDKYNQRVVNMYVQRVDKKDGKLVNTIVANLGRVTQEDTWTWWQK
jgi:branched-chain amino acid transport system substrate-binding protein